MLEGERLEAGGKLFSGSLGGIQQRLPTEQRQCVLSLSDVYSLPIHSQQLAVEGPLRPSSVRGAAAEGFCLYGMKEGRKEGSRWNDGRKEVGDVCTLALYVSILLTLVSSNRLFV